MADYERVEREAELKALARDLLREKVIAVDTEADSFYHYFDKTCLVQIASSQGIYLVDPLALGGPAELAPLAPVFAAKKIRKVFHAAGYAVVPLPERIRERARSDGAVAKPVGLTAQIDPMLRSAPAAAIPTGGRSHNGPRSRRRGGTRRFRGVFRLTDIRP